MTAFNAFVTPEYPVLFSLEGGEDEALPWEPSGDVFDPLQDEGAGDDPSVPPGYVGISIALLVKGMPSFLTTHVVEASDAPDIVESLESGDARVAVVGVTVDAAEELPEGVTPAEGGKHPAAFVSLLCGDGRRLAVARIVARDDSHSPEALAKYVIKQISRGVQVPDLASAR